MKVKVKDEGCIPSQHFPNNVCIYGPYIRYVGGAEFVGVMKHFRHILMGHEIYFKHFDRSHIFLSFVFVILFFKLRGLRHKIFKLAIKEIQAREAMLNKSHQVIHSANIRQFGPNSRVFVLST